MNTNNEAVKGYFTEEIYARIREMTNDEMKTLLKELEGTPFWFAILKYAQDRIMVIQSSFLTMDVQKEATNISRYQGAITGMLDLQDAVLSLKFAAKQAEDPNVKKEKNKDDLGGAYGRYEAPPEEEKLG